MEGFQGTCPGQQMFGLHPVAGVPTTRKNVNESNLLNFLWFDEIIDDYLILRK